MVEEHDYTREGLDRPDDPPIVEEADQFEEALSSAPSASPLPQTNQQVLLSFGEAMDALAKGEKITRLEWKNSDYGILNDGWLMISRNDVFHKWLVSDGDILATDWVIIPETN